MERKPFRLPPWKNALVPFGATEKSHFLPIGRVRGLVVRVMMDGFFCYGINQ